MPNKLALADHLRTTPPSASRALAGIRRRRDMLSDMRQFQAIEAETKRPHVGCHIPEGAASYVYFIQAASGPIKIGVAVNPLTRLSGLQTANHESLHLMAVLVGAYRHEMDYHRQFAGHRLHGEWFAPHPDILAEIERLNA